MEFTSSMQSAKPKMPKLLNDRCVVFIGLRRVSSSYGLVIRRFRGNDDTTELSHFPTHAQESDPPVEHHGCVLCLQQLDAVPLLSTRFAGRWPNDAYFDGRNTSHFI